MSHAVNFLKIVLTLLLYSSPPHEVDAKIIPMHRYYCE